MRPVRNDAFLDRCAGGMQLSSTRSLRSFTSTSVEPPTRITATPPASFASAPAASRGRSPRWSPRTARGSGCSGPEYLLLASALDDRGVLLLDQHLLRLAEIVQLDVLELDAKVLADHGAAGEDRDVLEHRLAAITEARRLHRRDLQAAAQLVHHQGGKRLALDSSAMISSGRPDCTMLSSSGSIGCRPDSFFSWIRMYG